MALRTKHLKIHNFFYLRLPTAETPVSVLLPYVMPREIKVDTGTGEMSQSQTGVMFLIFHSVHPRVLVL